MLLQTTSELVNGLSLISPVFTVVIGIIVAFIALSYMAGKTTSREDWVAMSKVELSELLKSVLLFVFIIGFYVLVLLIAKVLLKDFIGIEISDQADLIAIVVSLLRDVALSLQVKYLTLMEMAHQMKLFSDATAKVGPGTLHIRLPIFVGSDLLFQSVEVLIFACITGLHSINAQMIMFDHIRILTTYLFFPIGLFLRLIPTTREAGNELIAFGIIGSIILPFLYIFMFTIINDVISSHASHGWEDPVHKPSTISTKLFVMPKSIAEGILKLAVFYSPFFVYIPINFIFMIKEVSWLLFFAVAIPTFAITVSASLIRALMAFLDLDAGPTFVG